MKHRGSLLPVLAVIGSLAFPATASAVPTPFRQLGWTSSMGVRCMDVTCRKVGFTLDLGGLESIHSTNGAGPKGPGNAGGFVNFFTLNSFSSLVDNSTPTHHAVDHTVVVATSTSNDDHHPAGEHDFAFLHPTDQCVAGHCTHPVDDFHGIATTATPEPLTMSLLATGLIGLLVLARRRKKQPSV